MTTPGDINLIKAQTEFSPDLILLEQRLRQASYIAISAVLFFGMIAAGTYFFLQARVSELKSEEQRLSTAISKSSRKEGLYLSFKDRVTVVSKITSLQIPLSVVMESIRRIVPTAALSAFAIDEKRTVSTSITASSVEDLVTFVANVFTETKNQRIKNPVLEGITLGKDGTYKMTLSFTAVTQL